MSKLESDPDFGALYEVEDELNYLSYSSLVYESLHGRTSWDGFQF